MSTYRQQAIEDVAKAMGRSSGRLSYAVKNGGLGVKAKELAYAVAQRERVIEQAAEILELEAQVARLTAPVTRHEWEHAYPTAKLAWEVMSDIIAARAKEGQ
jgi:hypothetical protein